MGYHHAHPYYFKQCSQLNMLVKYFVFRINLCVLLFKDDIRNLSSQLYLNCYKKAAFTNKECFASTFYIHVFLWWGWYLHFVFPLSLLTAPYDYPSWCLILVFSVHASGAAIFNFEWLDCGDKSIWGNLEVNLER